MPAPACLSSCEHFPWRQVELEKLLRSNGWMRSRQRNFGKRRGGKYACGRIEQGCQEQANKERLSRDAEPGRGGRGWVRRRGQVFDASSLWIQTRASRAGREHGRLMIIIVIFMVIVMVIVI